MLLPCCDISLKLIFFTVLVTTIGAYPYPEDDKTIDLKIGFDLTHGENGAPALRIRDFEDSRELRSGDDNENKKQLNNDNEEKKAISIKKKTYLRAGASADASSSHSAESDGKNSNESKLKERSGAKGVKEKQKKEASSSYSGSGESEPDAKRSTRGMAAGDFDPEEKTARSGDEDDRRRKRSADLRLRHKREAETFLEHYYKNLKRKHKKVKELASAPSTTYKPY